MLLPVSCYWWMMVYCIHKPSLSIHLLLDMCVVSSLCYVMNKAAMNICAQVFMWMYIFISLGKPVTLDFMYFSFLIVSTQLATECPDQTLLSVRVFLDEMNIWINGFSKADGPLQCREASPNLLRAHKGTNIQSVEGLQQNQRWRKGESISFFGLILWGETSHLVFSGPRTAICSPGSQTLGLGLNRTKSLPRSPACWQQIVGLPSLQNYCFPTWLSF